MYISYFQISLLCILCLLVVDAKKHHDKKKHRMRNDASTSSSKEASKESSKEEPNGEKQLCKSGEGITSISAFNDQAVTRFQIECAPLANCTDKCAWSKTCSMDKYGKGLYLGGISNEISKKDNSQKILLYCCNASISSDSCEIQRQGSVPPYKVQASQSIGLKFFQESSTDLNNILPSLRVTLCRYNTTCSSGGGGGGGHGDGDAAAGNSAPSSGGNSGSSGGQAGESAPSSGGQSGGTGGQSSGSQGIGNIMGNGNNPPPLPNPSNGIIAKLPGQIIKQIFKPRKTTPRAETTTAAPIVPGG